MSVTMTTRVEIKEYTEYPKLRTAVTARMLKRIVELDAILKAASSEREGIVEELAKRMAAADVKVCIVDDKKVTRVDSRPGNKTIVKDKLLQFIDVEDLEKCMKQGNDVRASIRVSALGDEED